MFDPTLLNQVSTKQLETSTKKYNMRNCKATTKQLCAWIKINKIQVLIILRANKRLRTHLKRKKNHKTVIFLSMNAVTNYALQPSNVHAQHRKQPPFR